MMLSTQAKSPPARKCQSGAALVVGLLLLLVITLLAISGMGTATLELQMAGNMQYSRKALEAAEIGVETAIRATSFNTATVATVPLTPITTATGETDKYRTTTTYMVSTNVESGGSIGVNKGQHALHFDIASTGISSRGSTTNVVQAFYILGP